MKEYKFGELLDMELKDLKQVREKLQRKMYEVMKEKHVMAGNIISLQNLIKKEIE